MSHKKQRLCIDIMQCNTMSHNNVVNIDHTSVFIQNFSIFRDTKLGSHVQINSFLRLSRSKTD